jgi:hypothetical protein
VRRLATLLVVLAGLALAGPAGAARIVLEDADGRPITFDVRAPSVNPEWHARLLRRAAHGNEISRLTIRIVSRDELGATCGRHAGGCYRSERRQGLMVIPAGSGAVAAHTLLHEYAHHLDRWRGVAGVPEPNGTAHWWHARGMSRLSEEGRVTDDYAFGWDRAIGEIFAEDYVRLHLELPYKIGWLPPPDESVRAALAEDVPAVPEVAAAPPPLVLIRNGVLRGSGAQTVSFGLLGPDRRVTLVTRLVAGSEGRLTLRCAGRVVTRRVRRAEFVRIDERQLGPDRSCRAELRNTSRSPLRYSITLRLTIER